MRPNVVVLSGGVGGSKLVWGLYNVLEPENLAVITNPGDDIVLHGLRICPDFDIVLYTLSGVINPETGWGFKDETFHILEQLRAIGEETWFNLGDKDLATHILRTRLLSEGLPLRSVAHTLCQRFELRCTVTPPTNSFVQTMVRTDRGKMNFQEFYVREQCRPRIQGVEYSGMTTAGAIPEVLELISHASHIVFAPSNPIASIGPILAVRNIADAIRSSGALKIAVSPIIGGRSLKGPSDRMLEAMGLSADNSGIITYYGDLLDILVIDRLDGTGEEPDLVRDAKRVRELVQNSDSPLPVCFDTVLDSNERKLALARALTAL